MPLANVVVPHYSLLFKGIGSSLCLYFQKLKGAEIPMHPINSKSYVFQEAKAYFIHSNMGLRRKVYLSHLTCILPFAQRNNAYYINLIV